MRIAMRIKDMRIGQRLALGFGFIISLLVVLTAIGIYRVGQIDDALTEINQVNSVKQRYAINFRGSVHDRAIALRDVVLLDDAGELAGNAALIDTLTDDYAASAAPLDELLALSSEPREREILQSIKEIESETLPMIEQTRELRAAGDMEAARQLLLAGAKPAFITWLARINQFIDLQESKSQREAEAAVAVARGFATLMLVLSALAIAAGAAVAVAMTRSVVRPMQEALVVVERVGNGDLGSRIDDSRRDEAGQLLGGVRRMQDKLIAFSAAQSEIAERHEAGETSFRIDAKAHSGVFGKMARDINELVDAQIAVTQRTVSLVDRYAVGDFAENMDQLPGEMASITEAMDKTKANLTAISDEVKRLSAAAAAGDFSARGDAARFDHDFRAMVVDLNALMSTADTNFDDVSTILASLAEGDLTVRMEGSYPGVFGRIREDANRTVQRLAEIVRGIQASAGDISAASADIVSGSVDLSTRTEQQAARLEETATAMHQLTATVRQNSESARRANELARGAGRVAGSGGTLVGDVVATMDQISQSSRRIGDIIGVIDAITFQTNILALNAAVEAARAGEQGRGFAVVASEVRSLAQRSAAAAKDIKALIEGSVGKVDEGAELVARAGTTMSEIVASVQQVTDIIGEISAASAEQSAGIEQVSATVVQLDGATQQNASVVESASAAARRLDVLAAGLAGAAAVFRVHQAEAKAEAAAA